MEQVGKRGTVKDVLVILAAVALVSAWAAGAWLLWQDGQRIFSGMAVAVLLGSFAVAWRAGLR